MLEVRDVSAAYTSAMVIEGVSLDLGAGEVKAVLGRNGVGKSTLMKVIAGVLPARQGAVSLHGKVLPAAPAKRARLGLAYVPQGRDIFPRLTTVENIEVAAHACGHNASAAVESAFEKFPALKERANVMGGNLSGGQQQILAMARALALKPSVMLLDEPTEGIQPSIIMEIQEILRDLNASEGVAILVAEQNLDFVTGLASECYLMNRGRVERQLPMEEIRADSRLVQEMLGV
jgi:branched-chain amino acid transport system ATP-binding protein/urea transport system ATP-binding protein